MRAKIRWRTLCAKLPKCKYRKTEECAMCGECTVGEAYKIAKEHGIEAKSITSFENLIKEFPEALPRG